MNNRKISQNNVNIIQSRDTISAWYGVCVFGNCCADNNAFVEIGFVGSAFLRKGS